MRVAGRTRKYGEPLSVRIPVLFTVTQNSQLEGKVGSGDISTHIRDLVLRDIEEGAATVPERSLNLPVIAHPPCGPWDEAIADSHPLFQISEGVARELDAHEEDFFVRARGDSMVGAGILDSSLVLMRPLPPNRQPRRGDIVLLQVFCSEGTVESTIKRWRHGGEGLPEVEDGTGKALDLPPDTDRALPIAVARGSITAF